MAVVGRMVFDVRYQQPSLESRGLQDIRCPTCNNLLCRANLADGVTLELMCRKKGKRSYQGCGNTVTIRT